MYVHHVHTKFEQKRAKKNHMKISVSHVYLCCERYACTDDDDNNNNNNSAAVATAE